MNTFLNTNNSGILALNHNNFDKLYISVGISYYTFFLFVFFTTQSFLNLNLFNESVPAGRSQSKATSFKNISKEFTLCPCYWVSSLSLLNRKTKKIKKICIKVLVSKTLISILLYIFSDTNTKTNTHLCLECSPLGSVVLPL